jgi:Ca2+-binding EF-hand superfamily protein
MGQSLSGISSEHLNNEQLQLLHRKFARLCQQPASNTSKKLQPAQLRSYIRDLQKLPELAGNPLVPRLFQLLDQDCDGSLSFEEFVQGVEWFGTLQNEENDIPRLYQLAFRFVIWFG